MVVHPTGSNRLAARSASASDTSWAMASCLGWSGAWKSCVSRRVGAKLDVMRQGSSLAEGGEVKDSETTVEMLKSMVLAFSKERDLGAIPLAQEPRPCPRQRGRRTPRPVPLRSMSRSGRTWRDPPARGRPRAGRLPLGDPAAGRGLRGRPRLRACRESRTRGVKYPVEPILRSGRQVHLLSADSIDPLALIARVASSMASA